MAHRPALLQLLMVLLLLLRSFNVGVVLSSDVRGDNVRYSADQNFRVQEELPLCRDSRSNT